MATIHPYLNFNGTAEKAFRFYESVFGGELYIQKMKDVPGTENIPEQDHVMHASLKIGNNLLMASDILESAGHKLQEGNNYYISYEPDNRAEADRIFTALAEGGKIETPMEDMFWGAYFGSVQDQYGIRWMINCTQK
jgi:PhnB protein